MGESAFFLAQVFAAIWAIAAHEAEAEGRDLSETIGLGRADLIALAVHWQPAPDAFGRASAARDKVLFD